MRMILLVLGASLALGLATGGRPRRLTLVDVRWVWLALLGLALQLVPSDLAGELAVPLLLLSFVLLVVFVARNLPLWGFELLLVGVLLNLLVIGVNDGMPVSRQALVASDQADTLGFLRSGGGAKHHVAGPDDRLVFLGDVIAIPSPVRQAISLGDLFTYAGVGLLVVTGMNGRARRSLAVPAAGATGAGVPADG
jgi:hypothetical protein